MAEEEKKDSTEENQTDTPEGEDAETEGEEGQAKPKKKLLFLIAGGVGLLSLIGAALFLFVFKSDSDTTPSVEEVIEGKNINALENNTLIDGPSVYKDLEQKSLNLLTTRGTRFLKVKISLEYVGPVDEIAYAEALPRIDDELNTYLRQRRPDDFKGTAKIYKIKEDLLLRLGQASYPLRLRNVLFRELVVQ